MGGGGGPLDIIQKKGPGGLLGLAKETFQEDTAENILLMGAPQGLKLTQKELGLGPGEELTPPSVPASELSPEEEVQAAAKRKREFERIRRSGFQGRASTVKTGPSGPSANLQTTFKQLGGR